MALGGLAIARRVRGGRVLPRQTISCCCWSVTVLLYIVATLGLNIQFGYAGVLNFAGASFFGIGAYTVRGAQRAHRCAASARAADRRPDGRADRLAAAAAGAAHPRPLRRAGDHRVRAAAQDLPRGQRRARRPAGHAGQGHEHPRLVVQRQYRDRRDRAVVLHELFRRQPAAAGRPPSSWCAGWSAPGSGSISTRCGSTRPRRAASGSTSRAGRSPRSRSAISSSASPARCSAWSAASSRPTTTPSPIRCILVSILLLGGIGNPWGLVVATDHRRGRAGEAADDPGIPLPALCRCWSSWCCCSGPRACCRARCAAIFPDGGHDGAASAGGARPHQALRRRGGARPARSRRRAATKSSA